MRLVFVVHGMGIHRDKWAASISKTLAEVATPYGAFKTGPSLTAQVSVVEIRYDEIFERQVNSLGAELAELKGLLKTAGIRLGKLSGWLEQATPDEQTFFWTHAVDVVLYRFIPDIRNSVRVRVMDQMVTAINRAKEGGENVEVSVLAHSLGTTVATGALHLLSTTRFNGSDAFLLGNDLRVLNFFAVANVNRVLKDDFDPYTSHIRPSTAAPSTYCHRYFNFKHVFDPFLRVQTFAPPSWGTNYRNEAEIRHLHEFNVHGFEHYLRHPAVHIPIINGIFSSPVISTQERLKAIAAFPALSGPCLLELSALRDGLEKLPAATNLEDALVRATQALAIGHAAAKACDA